MSSTNLFDLALELSDPSKYDSIPPEARAQALEEAISSTDNSEELFRTEASRKIALRAICDPWSSTRKKLSKAILAKIFSSSSSLFHPEKKKDDTENDHQSSVLSFIREGCGEILEVNMTQEQPWYAIDGFLLFIKLYLQEQFQESSTPRSFLLRNVLPHCVHAQECVRESAADIVVELLITNNKEEKGRY